MVVFSGGEPVGVLIGAKRPSGTLIYKIAVHPDHRREGHGRHLLDSLGSKLAILGPPRIVAEIPERFSEVTRLFEASGYALETVLTDYVWHSERQNRALPGLGGSFLIPVTVDDLTANGLVDGNSPQTCWERSVETLTARKEEIAGLAVASGERLEAFILYMSDEIVALRTLVENGATRLEVLLSHLPPAGASGFRLRKVHPAELSNELLEMLGFRVSGGHQLLAATARSA